MKIIKEFEDSIFLDSIKWWAGNDVPERWIWGLGDNGIIYFIDKQGAWMSLKAYRAETIAGCVAGSISTMKRLVKEFGHLIVFI